MSTIEILNKLFLCTQILTIFVLVLSRQIMILSQNHQNLSLVGFQAKFCFKIFILNFSTFCRKRGRHTPPVRSPEPIAKKVCAKKTPPPSPISNGRQIIFYLTCSCRFLNPKYFTFIFQFILYSICSDKTVMNFQCLNEFFQ